jgi:hypothetical protein
MERERGKGRERGMGGWEQRLASVLALTLSLLVPQGHLQAQQRQSGKLQVSVLLCGCASVLCTLLLLGAVDLAAGPNTYL